MLNKELSKVVEIPKVVSRIAKDSKKLSQSLGRNFLKVEMYFLKTMYVINKTTCTEKKDVSAKVSMFIAAVVTRCASALLTVRSKPFAGILRLIQSVL